MKFETGMYKKTGSKGMKAFWSTCELIKELI